MRIVVATVQVPFVRGGAEVLVDDLVRELRVRGHEAEVMALPFTGNPPTSVLDQALAFRLIDLDGFVGKPIDRVIAVKFPAYLLRHHDVVTWLCHQYRDAYELWDRSPGLIDTPEGRDIRDAVRALDTEVLGGLNRRYAISKTVAERVEKWCGCPAEVLRPPVSDAALLRGSTSEPAGATPTDAFRGDLRPPLGWNPHQNEGGGVAGDPHQNEGGGVAGDPHQNEGGGYLLYPSRLTPIKRQDLAIRALVHAPGVDLVLAGAPDTDQIATKLGDLADELGVASRVHFTGEVPRAELIELYQNARAVVFTPHDEDYGYVTIEAMIAGKAVLTCFDSGGPLEFVEDGVSGLVVDPDPRALGEAMTRLADPDEAALLGASAQEASSSLTATWDEIITTLTAGR